MFTSSFRGELFFLSNMYPITFSIPGISYPFKSSEHFFQASLALNDEDVIAIIHAPDGWKAKAVAKKFPRKADFREIQDSVMAMALYYKFLYSVELREKLLAVPVEVLVEVNNWHDNYWGACSCNACVNKPKLNKLGYLLTITRNYFASIKRIQDMKA